MIKTGYKIYLEIEKDVKPEDRVFVTKEINKKLKEEMKGIER